MGTFLIVNNNYILSLAYIDVIVSCNVPDVWKFGPLGLCLSLGRQWASKHMHYLVSKLESFGYQPLRMEQCTLRPEGIGTLVFKN